MCGSESHTHTHMYTLGTWESRGAEGTLTWALIHEAMMGGTEALQLKPGRYQNVLSRDVSVCNYSLLLECCWEFDFDIIR